MLEINSKTGLYPLYVTYSIFRSRCAACSEEELDDAKLQQLWDATVRENVFVICKTPMAKQITRRTLAGYRDIPVNAHYFDDLINMMKNKPRQFVDRVLKPSYWKQEGVKTMKFDAVVGNPPYQVMDGGNKASASPIYQFFVEQSKNLNPKYVSMVIPARWYSGGKGLDQFRADMLNDRRMAKLIDYTNSLDCFPNVDIAGGVCYFLWDSVHNGECNFKNISNGTESAIDKYLNEFDTLIRYPIADKIIRKVLAKKEGTLASIVSSRKPFGLATNVRPMDSGDLTLRYNGGTGKFERSSVKVGIEIIDSWKVMISYLSAEHAGQPDKNGQFKILSTTEILPPKTICTETYLIAGSFTSETEAQNYYNYLKTKFVRFLIGQIAVSQHITKSSFSFVPMQNFSKPWTDAELYKKYGLAEEEIAFIESMIKPME